MSVITGLKNIDIQKYAVVSILDALGVDIDPGDGHLYYAAEPNIPLKLNDKVLRVDVGRMIRGVQYANYNPLYREDHAQFLMTIAIYAEVMEDLINPEEAKADDFEIYTEVVFPTEGPETAVPHTLATVTRKYGKNERGQGFHKETPMAIVLAVMDFSNQIGLVPGEMFKTVREAIDLAYAESLKMAEMKLSERKRDLKEKAALLRPEIEIEDQVFYDDDINPERNFEPDLMFDGDETWKRAIITDVDFIPEPDDNFLKDDADWRTTEFSTDELKELLGVVIPKHPEVSGVDLADISDIGFIPQEPIETPVESEFYVPQDEFIGNGNPMAPGMVQQRPIVHPILPDTNAQMPDIRLEDVVSEDELKKIQERENKESISTVEDFVNSSGFQMGIPMGFGNDDGFSGVGYIPQ